MPRQILLGDLRLAAQQRCDKESDDSILTPEWNRILSGGWAELFAAVASTGLRYFETAANVAATGAASYQEPVDIYETVGVSRIDSSGREYPLRELMAQETYRFAGQTGDAVGFAHIDDQLYLYPSPASGTYRWRYVYAPPDLTGQADSFVVDVCVPDGESFVIWDAVVKALAKEDSDTSLARAEREACRERVMDWAAQKTIEARKTVITPGGFDEIPGWDDGWGGWNGAW